MDRFFIANLNRAVLTAAEAHHCRQVTRHNIGDTITVFDGRGHEAQCQITGFTPDEVQLQILSRTTTPPLRCRLLLAQAVPKKNMDLIVQKATELGVAEIYPLLSERTVVEASGRLDRWRAIAPDLGIAIGAVSGEPFPGMRPSPVRPPVRGVLMARVGETWAVVELAAPSLVEPRAWLLDEPGR